MIWKSLLSYIASIPVDAYSLPHKKVYTFVELSTQNRGGKMKGRGSKLGQASFWNSQKWLQTNKNIEETCFNLFEFQTEAWSSLDQLNRGGVVPPTFPVALLGFEYLALPQVYTFFRGRLYNAREELKIAKGSICHLVI